MLTVFFSEIWCILKELSYAIICEYISIQKLELMSRITVMHTRYNLIFHYHYFPFNDECTHEKKLVTQYLEK